MVFPPCCFPAEFILQRPVSESLRDADHTTLISWALRACAAVLRAGLRRHLLGCGCSSIWHGRMQGVVVLAERASGAFLNC